MCSVCFCDSRDTFAVMCLCLGSKVKHDKGEIKTHINKLVRQPGDILALL